LFENKNKVLCLLLLTGMVAILFEFAPLTGQINITVYTSDVVASGVSTKYGININAGIDNDINRPPGTRPLYQAIQETGAKHIRFPGGNKSLYYSWASPPYTNPATQYWVPNSWYDQAARNTINFDQFIILCKQVGAVPHVNVAYNPGAGFNANLAAAWVKYANVTRDYGVEYWEIGNEMWKGELGFSVSSLASVVSEYSLAMKAIDPTIKIGVSWGDAQAIINACGSHIDFVTMSNYAGSPSYSEYANASAFSLKRINEGASKKSVASEFSPISWDNSAWDKTNNTAKGLMNFDMVGQLLKSPNCEYACFWNTRWFAMDGSIYDGLDNNNNFLPGLKPLVLWQKFIQDKLVRINSPGTIVSYAAYNSGTGALNLFFINKSAQAQNVNITITSPDNYGSPAQIWQYKGESANDVNPSLGNTGSVAVTGNQISGLSLPSTSITAILLTTVSSGAVPFPPDAKEVTDVSGTGFTASWEAQSGVDTIYFDLSTEADFNNFVTGYDNKKITGFSTFICITGLEKNTTYYYRLRGGNAAGISSNSDTILVKTLVKIAEPLAHDATNILTSTFTALWDQSPGATAYLLNVSDTDDFSSFVQGLNTMNAGNNTLAEITGLQPETTFYYRVRAIDASDTSNFSNIVQFKTLAILPVPVATNATGILKTGFTANWDYMPLASKYYLDVSADSGFNSFISGFKGKNAGNVTSKSLSGLAENTTYFYRVRSWYTAANEISKSSNAITVTTAGTTGLTGSKSKTGYKCYPNPVNKIVTLELPTPVPAGLTLSIFNMGGQLVKTLEPYSTLAGNNCLTIDVSDMPPGLYLVKIVSGGMTEIVKLNVDR
jgi:hypothetical protein